MAFLSGDQEMLSKQNPLWHKTSLSISVVKFSPINSAVLIIQCGRSFFFFFFCGKAKNKSKLNSAFDFCDFLEKWHYLSALHAFQNPQIYQAILKINSQIVHKNKAIPLITYRKLQGWSLYVGSTFLLEIKANFIPVYYKEDSLSHISSLSSKAMNVPFFFLKIALAIRGFLYFHTNWEIICSSSVKNTVGSLIGIALNL